MARSRKQPLPGTGSRRVSRSGAIKGEASFEEQGIRPETESTRDLPDGGLSGRTESKPGPFAGFDTERRTYERLKSKLLHDEGKYVLIKGDIMAGIWLTREEAVEAGYGRFGLQPFYVKQILDVDPVILVTRDVLSCPT